MKTLKEALFSRKNLKPTNIDIDELYSRYSLVVLEYLTNDVDTAFMILDNKDRKSNAIVKDVEYWYTTGRTNDDTRILKGFFDSRTHPVKFYCKESSPSDLFYILEKFLKDIHHKEYNIEKTRKRILNLMGTYIEFDPIEINIG